jgi:hypothetical protein
MNLMNYPFALFAICFAALSLAAIIGSWVRRRHGLTEEDEHEDLTVILNATLTLLGLLIGFSFSMATTRYDQRKNYEEAEANAIGTEYLRLGMLAPEEASKTRQMLKSYLDERIRFYEVRDRAELDRINASTAQLQNDLWSAAQKYSMALPTAASVLLLSGMNDVLNSQGYTQAAWWNRLPVLTWVLMIAIGICCNAIFGYNARRARGLLRLFVMPLIVAVAFFLIADLDSPRGGIIRVVPQNLVSVAGSFSAPVTLSTVVP